MRLCPGVLADPAVGLGEDKKNTCSFSKQLRFSSLVPAVVLGLVWGFLFCSGSGAENLRWRKNPLVSQVSS